MTKKTLTLTGKDLREMLDWHDWIDRLIERARPINIAIRILEQ